MKLIKINVIFFHGNKLSTFTEKLWETGVGPKFALYVLKKTTSYPLVILTNPQAKVLDIIFLSKWGFENKKRLSDSKYTLDHQRGNNDGSFNNSSAEGI